MQLDNLNVLRAISIVSIIIGHICLQLGYEPVGRLLGYLFVQIFFLLSAFLLGMKSDKLSVGGSFILKRWKKLSFSYYPFLIISVIILLLLSMQVTIKSIILHFLYVNYLVQDSLCGVAFGHLWYISMQMLCYILVGLLCREKIVTFIRELKIVGFVTLTAVVLGAALLSGYFNIPPRIIIVLSSYIVVFVRARDIYTFIQSIESRPKYITVLAFGISNFVCLYLFLFYDLCNKLLLRDLIILTTSIFWLAFFMCVLKNCKSIRIVTFISSISFELYLVHHPFILGEYSLLSDNILFNDVVANGVFAIGIVFILALLLQKLSVGFKNVLPKFLSLC